ncbi:phosphotransferase [Streptomyces sp. NBC_00287]|uniref:phosphotransferase n=1 Tax=Streptomyces sp. NBC_00287 TaxID=2975702 RepID=UPI002E2CCACE|nr:phosphotransferase [Streptomyces sp. NBC_00287]
MTTYFTKHYATDEQAGQAARHYGWLATHAQPFRQPTLTVSGPAALSFTWVQGRHAEQRDLPELAALLGDAHGAAWASDLHGAELTRAHQFSDGTEFSSYLGLREEALRRRRQQGFLPTDRALDMMLAILNRTAEGPTAFYKDSNLRNFLFTDDGTVFVVDTDHLSLAPFAYDLAKLVTSLIMTHGPLPDHSLDGALGAYNEAAARHDARLGATDRDRLDDFLALHAVLTAPYSGRHGYRHADPIASHGPERSS